jgi:NAD(P) transhydrogenase subunit alpha
MVGIYVFVLSCFIGYYVIWGVTPALHAPLMAVTNAISAIVVVGALFVAGAGSESFGVLECVGFFAVILVAINIFGGFIVSNRMLSMFKKKK